MNAPQADSSTPAGSPPEGGGMLANLKQDLLKGKRANGRNYKVHLDGYNLLPALKGETDSWPREEFLYWTDDGSVAALRYKDWKITFLT